MKIVSFAMLALMASTSLVGAVSQITFDESILTGPALSDDVIKAVNHDFSSTWTAGRSDRFEGITLRAASSMLGAVLSTDNTTFLPYKRQGTLSELPDDFDWRDDARAGGCPSLREIRDQANCGACWAFASVEVMTDRLCIASMGALQAHLSVQQVVSCAPGVPNAVGLPTSDGCNGGRPIDAFQYYEDEGLVTGGNFGDESMCYPYELAPCSHHSTSDIFPECPETAETPVCAAGSCDNESLDWEASRHYGVDGHSVCSADMDEVACQDAMRQEVYQQGPIAAIFLVRHSFFAYKSGVFNPPQNEYRVGGHAIKILGWGSDAGVPYWLCANSWNEDWGEAGFFRIIRGTNEGQMETSLFGGPVAGMPKLSVAVV